MSLRSHWISMEDLKDDSVVTWRPDGDAALNAMFSALPNTSTKSGVLVQQMLTFKCDHTIFDKEFQPPTVQCDWTSNFPPTDPIPVAVNDVPKRKKREEVDAEKPTKRVKLGPKKEQKGRGIATSKCGGVDEIDDKKPTKCARTHQRKAQEDASKSTKKQFTSRPTTGPLHAGNSNSGGKIYGLGDTRDGYRKMLMNEKVWKHGGGDMIELLAVGFLSVAPAPYLYVFSLHTNPEHVGDYLFLVTGKACRKKKVLGWARVEKMYAIGAPCGFGRETCPPRRRHARQSFQAGGCGKMKNQFRACSRRSGRENLKIEEGRKVPEFPTNSAGAVAGSQRLNFDFLAFTSRGFEAVGSRQFRLQRKQFLKEGTASVMGKR
ncbi:hypothetical protein C8J57DRAFT_1591763 [Mycena rebaudengoi]|nr:hypothetical protein C8J57DRAFT_1591763 [Mycena rebaudengoi]